MSTSNTTKTALLLIDIQKGFLPPYSVHWGPSRSNPSFESNAASILTSYRRLKSSPSLAPSQHKIIHIQHASTSLTSPLHPSKSETFDFQDWATPEDDEVVVIKDVNSGFIGTNLEEILRSHFGTHENTKVYILGLSTDHCVSTTTRMAGNLKVAGEVVLIGDATAAWEKVVEEGDGEGLDAELVMRVHLQSLREFARVSTTKRVLEEVQALRD